MINYSGLNDKLFEIVAICNSKLILTDTGILHLKDWFGAVNSNISDYSFGSEIIFCRTTEIQ